MNEGLICPVKLGPSRWLCKAVGIPQIVSVKSIAIVIRYLALPDAPMFPEIYWFADI